MIWGHMGAEHKLMCQEVFLEKIKRRWAIDQDTLKSDVWNVINKLLFVTIIMNIDKFVVTHTSASRKWDTTGFLSCR